MQEAREGKRGEEGERCKTDQEGREGAKRGSVEGREKGYAWRGVEDRREVGKEEERGRKTGAEVGKEGINLWLMDGKVVLTCG